MASTCRPGPIMLSPFYTHRHPDFWIDPDHFDPDRWTRDAETTRHGHSYHPFAAGPRICIGNNFSLLESHLLLAILARRFRPRLRDGFVPHFVMRGTLSIEGGTCRDRDAVIRCFVGARRVWSVARHDDAQRGHSVTLQARCHHSVQRNSCGTHWTILEALALRASDRRPSDVPRTKRSLPEQIEQQSRTGPFAGPKPRATGASRRKQVKPTGASESALVGAQIPSKLAMQVRFSSPAPQHRS